MSKEKTTPIPIFLLKTKSLPNDGYEEYFTEVREGERGSEPIFVPVLEHRFDAGNLGVVRGLLDGRKFGVDGGYGGLIFTSQRAVEALRRLVGEKRGKLYYIPLKQINSNLKENDTEWPYLQDIPIYTVGPATSRALKNICPERYLNIFGEETGNGEALAHYILDHYGKWYHDHPSKPPLLFLVGEQRRDIIPKTLMSPDLPKDATIPVEELVVYGTGVMESFEHDFTEVLKQTEDRPTRWVVVFSPTGCEAMLRVLGMLDPETGRVKTGERGGGCGVRRGKRKTYIASIGPTTRDYLRRTFGFEVDVCAEKPSPEGVRMGIGRFMDGISVAGETAPLK